MLIVTTPELEQRMRQVRALLDSRYDYLPSVHVTDLGDTPGPAKSKRAPCDHCDRTGVLAIRPKPAWPLASTRLCPVCDGHGWRRRRVDDEEWDEYTESPLSDVQLGAAGLPSLGESIQRLTSSIDRIQADLDARAGEFDKSEQYGWEKVRRSYYRNGSYAELDRVLIVMGRESPHLRSALLLAVAHALPRDDDHQAVIVEIGTAYVARKMRGPIRVPNWIMYERSVKQTVTVKQLALDGMKAPQIAKRLGLSKSKVKHMLKRPMPS